MERPLESRLRCPIALGIISLIMALPHMTAAAQNDIVLSDEGLQGLNSEPFTGVVKVARFRGDRAEGKPIYIIVRAGVLNCRLEANDNDKESFYIAVFLQGDRAIKYEKWSVPNVSYPLRLVDIQRSDSQTRPSRSLLPATYAESGSVSNTAGSVSISISDVTGLAAELAARPYSGPGYAPGRALMADPTGFISAVEGDPSDCVRVDGSSGPCGTTPAGNVTPLAGDVTGFPSTTTVTALQSRPVSATAPADGQSLTWNASTNQWIPKSSAGAPSTQLAGDLGGTISKATVMGLQNRPVSATAPADGQAIIWSASSGTWAPQSVNAPQSNISEFSLVSSSPSTLTLNSQCTVLSPCVARFGDTAEVYASSSVLTIGPSSGVGTAFVYLSSSNMIGISHNLQALTCTGPCTTTFSATPAFPTGVIPLWSWNATPGTWAASGNDYRANLYAYRLIPGNGIVTVDTGRETLISVDAAALTPVIQGNASLTFGLVPSGSCAPVKQIQFVGVLPGQAVIPGWPASLPAGVLGQMLVTTKDAVSVTVCNLSGGPQNLSALPFAAAAYLTVPLQGVVQAAEVSYARALSNNERSAAAVVYVPPSTDGPAATVDYCYVKPKTGVQACATIPIDSCQSGCSVTFRPPTGEVLRYRVARGQRAGDGGDSDVWH